MEDGPALHSQTCPFSHVLESRDRLSFGLDGHLMTHGFCSAMAGAWRLGVIMESDVPAEQLGSALGIENLAKMGPNRKDLGYYK